MLKVNHHVVHHAKKVVAHVKKHQHKYIFLGGLLGGIFLVTKIIMLFGASYILYTGTPNSSYAQEIIEEPTQPEEEPTQPEEEPTQPEEEPTQPEEEPTQPEEEPTQPE
ncbi:MAG: hypothetical protein PHR61_03375, partial [Candidatus Absconditabacteria bacterium]|nr:hypothetical protein [Candidatus Absconditabacteria bacterium]